MNTVRFQDREIPVGKILCLGRNYAQHAKEMSAPVPEMPVVFLKPSTALVKDGCSVRVPSISKELHHEVEMVVMIGKIARGIDVSTAMEHIAGYGVGLDMTLRDIQAAAKKEGLPWTVAKGFDTSAPVSTIIDRKSVRDPHNLRLTLKVNGETRQSSNTMNMIFRIENVVSYLSFLFTLEPGDLIYTGTPEGVGPAASGDLLEAELESVGTLRVRIA